MSLIIEAEAPPLKQWDDGSVRVGGTRLLLEIVIDSYNRGLSAEEIVNCFPPISLADIHAVIAYYLNHKADVDLYLAEVERHAIEIKKIIESKSPPHGIRERLLARKNAKDLKK